MTFVCSVVLCGTALAAGQVTASSAFTWTTTNGGVETPFTSGQEETVTPSLKAGTEFIFEVTIGSTPFKVAAKRLSGEATKIRQDTGATGSGKYTLSETRIIEPVTCSAPKVITTNSLKSEIVAAPAIPSGLALKFVPAEGEVLFPFKLGGSCAWAGTTFQVKTSKGLFAETEPTGALKFEQPLRFSAAINQKAGGNMFTGANSASFTGEWITRLSGPFAGHEWVAR